MVLEASANRLTHENEIFLKTMEVFVRIATVFKYRDVKHLAATFSPFYQSFTDYFLQICCSGRQELVSRALPLSEAAEAAADFFEDVKCLLSFNFEYLFQEMGRCWGLLRDGQANETGRGNFLLVVGALLEREDYFEEGILGENLMGHLK